MEREESLAVMVAKTDSRVAALASQSGAEVAQVRVDFGAMTLCCRSHVDKHLRVEVEHLPHAGFDCGVFGKRLRRRGLLARTRLLGVLADRAPLHGLCAHARNSVQLGLAYGAVATDQDLVL